MVTIATFATVTPSVLIDALRIVSGLVLLSAGLAKLRVGPIAFARAILGYRLVPAGIASALARTLPVAEIILATFLLTGAFVPVATITSAGLVIAFSGAVSIALLRRQRNACGCGIGASEPVSWSLLVRNTVLLGALVVVYVSWEV